MGDPLAVNPEDRRKHLEFIQGVISRLSNSSATAKGWSLTLGGAAFGFSAANDKWYIALFGLVVLLAFSLIDAYYLHAERLFRDLYDGVRKNEVESFSMHARGYDYHGRKVETYLSWSVLGYYGPLLLAGIAVTVLLQQT